MSRDFLGTCLLSLCGQIYTLIFSTRFNKSAFNNYCVMSRSMLINVNKHKCVIDWEPHAQLDFGNLLYNIVPCLPHV